MHTRHHGHLHHHSTMLEGPIWKGLIAFAIPIFLGNLFQQLYNTADTFIVGNYIGKEALAAVSSSSNLIHMLIGLLNGTAMGAGVVIAKYYGAGDKRNMRTAIHTDVSFGFVAGLAMTVIGVIMTPHILRWMGTPPDVLPSSIAYFRTYFLGVIASFMYNIFMGILHAVGDSKRPLYYLIISSVINIGLDLLFVAVLKMGVASAALATVISQAVSAVLCFIQLIRTDEDYSLNLKELCFDKRMLSQIVRFGLPSGIQNSLIGFANVMVQTNINAFGSNAMAGCGSYSKIEGFAFLPVTCFAMGLSTFVGQNLGAKQYDRVKKGTKFGILCSITLAELVGAVIWIFAPVFIRLFNNDPEVVAFGVRQARVEAFFYFLLAFSHCIAGILRGAGKSTVPMITMMVSWCIIRVTYITIMVNIWHNITVVFTAYPLTWFISSCIFLVYYLKADWTHNFDRLEAKGRV